jgi:hypothetical protein
MRRKTLALAAEEELLIDLTFHKVSAKLVADFKEKIGIKGFYWVGRHLVPRTLFYSFFFSGLLILEATVFGIHYAVESYEFTVFFLFLGLITGSTLVLFIVESYIAVKKLNRKKREGYR